MRITTLLFLCFFYFGANAQQKIHIQYLSFNGKVKESKAEADIIREYTIPETGYIVGLKEFYRNGKVKLIGNAVVDGNKIMYIGEVMNYDINGKKQELTKYNKMGIKYLSYIFHPNGKLNKSIEYSYRNLDYEPDLINAEDNNIPNVYFKLQPKLSYYADSLEKVMVNDGNGYAVETTTYLGENFIESGNYKQGMKDGDWKGKNTSDTKNFVDKYRNGKFISGVMVVNGAEKKYNTLYTRPIHGLGNNHNVHAYLDKVKFQKNYAEEKTTDKKFTLLEVFVGPSGKIEDVILNDEDSYFWIKKKLTTTLLNMPAWKPATLRGFPVKAKYTSNIPIYTPNNYNP